MSHPRVHWRIALACIAILLTIPTIKTAFAEVCSLDCLRVYSIALRDLGTYISGTVKLTDEAGTSGGARNTVVHAIWTRPDGSSFDQYANIGSRLRAEFRLYTPGDPGVYTLIVAGATKSGYTFDPLNSAILNDSIEVGFQTNEPPMAIFNADAVNGSAPLTVNFDATDSFDPDGLVASYSWGFGDGNSSNEVNPSHTYSGVGNFITTLTVTDDEGATASNSFSIVVTDDIVGCGSHCMFVDSIALSYKATVGKVKGRVQLFDEKGGPVGDAGVHAVWTLPDGSTVDQYRNTGTKLRANFSLKARTAGTYKLTVVEVTKAEQTFDPDNSNVLTGMIEITP